MNEKTSTTTWMWAGDDGTYGLVLDNQAGKLLWYDAIGCLCGDDEHYLEQTVSEFQVKGTPWPVEPPPPLILAEIDLALAAITNDLKMRG